ncbi:MAG: hypothetical protein B7C24_14490 [Bacteroidetes bacterium 4572_77]|nr:MAG: hypothetical protein B7C24_14490 [Bacteroidetes bacterium 4572_77]
MNKITTLLFLILFSTSLLFAHKSDKLVLANRIDSAVTLDGRLDEDEWALARPMTGYSQKDPVFGGTPEEKTEIYILYDSKFLYIGARLHSVDIENIQNFVTRRDDLGTSERIIVTLDTYNDRKTAYSFAISVAGSRADYSHSKDSEYARDYNWNPVWTGKTYIDTANSCWTAEMKIPFTQLRFNNDIEQLWGINSNRYVPTTHEDLYWILVPRNESGWSSRFGTLVGIKNIHPVSSRLELLPYAVGGLDINSEIDNNNPYAKYNKPRANIGGDIKAGLGSNMILDATINPDFGQVEADPATVNLTEFETYYDEKRPFFIEGNTLFSSTGEDFYYSRRIGGPVHYRPRNCDYYDLPPKADIPFATKLTGRTISGMNYGVQTAITMNEFADCYIIENDSTFSQLVEPLTMYNVGRLQQEVDDYGSTYGAIVTSVNRLMDEDDEVAKMLNKNAYSAGMDWNLFLKKKKYNFSGYIGASSVNGSEEQMINVQSNHAHNFDRPDAKHLSIDSSLTALSGVTGKVALSNSNAKHWFWNGSASYRSAGLELSDMGKLNRADQISYFQSLNYKENKPSKYFYNYNFTLSSWQNFNTNFESLVAPVNFEASCRLPNFYDIHFNSTLYFGGQSDTKSRGGPMIALPSSQYAILYFSTDHSKENVLSSNISGYQDVLGGNSYAGELHYTINKDRMKIKFMISYTSEKNMLQYVTRLDGTENSLYGNRYVFAGIQLNTLSSTIRFNYAFTPDLTLELYAQPYASHGKYFDYGEMVKAGSYDMKKYGVEEGTSINKTTDGDYLITDGEDEFTLSDYNFNYISFRMSSVLRWEWLPGSTMYLVWQMNNSKTDNEVSRVNLMSWKDALIEPGINSLALKISWWIPINN